jgi:hypothetical protein
MTTVIETMNATNPDGTFKDLDGLDIIEDESAKKKDKTRDIDQFFHDSHTTENKKYRKCKICR